MPFPVPNSPPCPRCGSTNVTLCGQSVQYSPEEHPGQSLHERELLTVAYKCKCGLAFTVTPDRGEEKA